MCTRAEVTNQKRQTMNTKFKIGQKVIYRGAWGCGEPVKVTITGIAIHKGRRVYDLDIPQWGYENQFTAIN